MCGFIILYQTILINKYVYDFGNHTIGFGNEPKIENMNAGYETKSMCYINVMHFSYDFKQITTTTTTITATQKKNNDIN